MSTTPQSLTRKSAHNKSRTSGQGSKVKAPIERTYDQAYTRAVKIDTNKSPDSDKADYITFWEIFDRPYYGDYNYHSFPTTTSTLTRTYNKTLKDVLVKENYDDIKRQNSKLKSDDAVISAIREAIVKSSPRDAAEKYRITLPELYLGNRVVYYPKFRVYGTVYDIAKNYEELDAKVQPKETAKEIKGLGDIQEFVGSDVQLRSDASGFERGYLNIDISEKEPSLTLEASDDQWVDLMLGIYNESIDLYNVEDEAAIREKYQSPNKAVNTLTGNAPYMEVLVGIAIATALSSSLQIDPKFLGTNLHESDEAIYTKLTQLSGESTATTWLDVSGFDKLDGKKLKVFDAGGKWKPVGKNVTSFFFSSTKLPGGVTYPTKVLVPLVMGKEVIGSKKVEDKNTSMFRFLQNFLRPKMSSDDYAILMRDYLEAYALYKQDKGTSKEPTKTRGTPTGTGRPQGKSISLRPSGVSGPQQTSTIKPQPSILKPVLPSKQLPPKIPIPTQGREETFVQPNLSDMVGDVLGEQPGYVSPGENLPSEEELEETTDELN